MTMRAMVFCLCVLAAGSAVSAQTPRGPEPSLETMLTRGMTAWITDSTGREEKVQIVSVSGGIVTAAAGDDVRRLRTTEIVRVRVRRSDSVIDGALIGAGTALASGLFLCTRSEPWRNCRDDLGSMFWIGAAFGGGIDALIHGREIVYDAARGSTRLSAAPLVGRRAAGLQVSLGF